MDSASEIIVVKRKTVIRHRLYVRLTHWVSAFCLVASFMTGLQIFNADAALSLGKTTDFDAPILSIDASDDGSRGVTKLFGRSFDTTGVLGVSTGPNGPEQRAFPRWITVPADQDLATSRRYHFLFAWVLVLNGLVYWAFGWASGHFGRDMWPRLRDFAALPRSILDHIRLKFEPSTQKYNVLQKLTYAGVIFGAVPVMILAGITMSPGITSAFPFLLDAFGGRQTARTVHFAIAWALALFFFVHVGLVLVTGLGRHMRAMTTGRATETERMP